MAWTDVEVWKHSPPPTYPLGNFARRHHAVRKYPGSQHCRQERGVQGEKTRWGEDEVWGHFHSQFFVFLATIHVVF